MLTIYDESTFFENLFPLQRFHLTHELWGGVLHSGLNYALVDCLFRIITGVQ